MSSGLRCQTQIARAAETPVYLAHKKQRLKKQVCRWFGWGRNLFTEVGPGFGSGPVFSGSELVAGGCLRFSGG